MTKHEANLNFCGMVVHKCKTENLEVAMIFTTTPNGTYAIFTNNETNPDIIIKMMEEVLRETKESYEEYKRNTGRSFG